MDISKRGFAEQKTAKLPQTKLLDGAHIGNAILIRAKMWGQYPTEWYGKSGIRIKFLSLLF